MRALVIDVSGTHMKGLVTIHKKPAKIPSGPHMTVAKMVAPVRAATVMWAYHAVSIGYSGSVVYGSPLMGPHHLGRGWFNEGGRISEQWSAGDMPEKRLRRGLPTGAAMPLCWSHAEYVSLVRSAHDGVCFDRVEPAFYRYVVKGPT